MTQDNSSTKTVYQQIIGLANQHSVSYQETDLDVMAVSISSLSDNDIVNNDATRALINLRRAKVLNAQQAHTLLLDLLKEMQE